MKYKDSFVQPTSEHHKILRSLRSHNLSTFNYSLVPCKMKFGASIAFLAASLFNAVRGDGMSEDLD